MINKQQGFTIIELIIVISIITILSVIILPKIFYLSSDAQQNVTNNIAANLNTAARVNFYARMINHTHGIPIKNCKNTITALQVALPSGYSVISKNIPIDAIVSCTLKGPNKTKATFNARGIN
jgi:prepilin-type N-terminal cleavage/methylation domain-containing protein